MNGRAVSTHQRNHPFPCLVLTVGMDSRRAMVAMLPFIVGM